MRRLSNRRGQLMIEAILLMVVMFGVFMAVTRQIRDNQLATQLVTGPWGKVAGMTEFGVWDEPSETNRKKHPNTYDRFYTPEPQN